MNTRRTRLALTALLLGLVAPLGASAAAAGTAPQTAAKQGAGWNDGTSDADTIWDCILQQPSTGVYGNAGWLSPDGEVPEIGEVFHLRGYVGLVSVPCSGEVAVLPEIMPPAGIEYAEGPVMWDVTRDGETQHLRSGGLEFFHGANGGVVIAQSGDNPFELRRGDVLEFQFPVIATRELKGPATRQPECQDRRSGTAPCPIAQAGDHFQIAFTVGGHGGDKSYVTPYVALFAVKPGSGHPASAKLASSTNARFVVGARKPGRAVVTVKAGRTPTGKVVVTDKGRTIATSVLVAADKGRITMKLPRLRAGVHKLAVRYLGSSSVKPSASGVTKVRVR